LQGKDVYFDSFGSVPPEQVEKALQNNYYYSCKQIQDLNATSCGYYCVCFLHYFQNHFDKDVKTTYENFVNLFGDDTKRNEIILSKYVNKF